MLKFKPLIFSRKSKKNLVERSFQDIKTLQVLILDYLKKEKSAPVGKINWYVVSQLFQSHDTVKAILDKEDVRERLSSARKKLREEKEIGYNSKTQLWFLEDDAIEPGWHRISEKTDVLKWILEKFHPEIHFEPFCCSFLEHCEGEEVTQTPKRAVSGADGGLDGTCKMKIHGQIETVGFEAKQWGIDQQVGTDICDKLIGVMHRLNLKYGFIITTAKFSARAQKQIEEEENFAIEMIDGEKLIDLMLRKSDIFPEGLGLQDRSGSLFINYKMIKDAANKRF